MDASHYLVTGRLQKADGSGLASQGRLRKWRQREQITFWVALAEKGRRQVGDGDPTGLN